MIKERAEQLHVSAVRVDSLINLNPQRNNTDMFVTRER
jgi:hypothetical protein